MPLDLSKFSSPADIQRRRELAQSRSLYRTTQLQERRAGLLTGHKFTDLEKPKPSLLSRIFDVISRPVYATTNFLTQRTKEVAGDIKKGNILGAVMNGIKPMPDVKEAKAVAQGFWGTHKGSFSETLKAAGVKNKLALGLGGFVGDVALDPTTYLTFGTNAAVKSGLKEIAQSAIKSAGEHLASEAAKKVGEKAAAEATAKGIAEKLSSKELKSTISQARREAIRSHVYDALQAEKKAKEGSTALKYQMKFMGKPILQSELIPQMVSKVGARAAENPSVQAFRKLFSTNHILPEEAKFVKDMVKGQNYLHMHEAAKQIRGIFADTSRAERRQISLALEAGNIASLPEKLQSKAKFARDMFDEWGHIESIQIGALKPEQVLPNYVYHAITGKDTGKLKKLVQKVAGTEAPGFANKRKYNSILELEQAIKDKGLHATVDDDIASILFRRAQKHGELATRKAYVDELVNRFGVPLASKDKKEVSKAVKDAGLLTKAKSKFVPKDVLFDPEIAKAVDHTDSIILRDPAVGHFLKKFDKIQNAWKFGTTVPNPGFHVRNLLGDAWNNYLDGVVNPHRYTQGATLAVSMEKGTLDAAKKVKIKVGKLTLDGNDIIRLYREKGLKSGFVGAEYGEAAKGVRGILEKAATAGRGVSEVREDTARMAHFIDGLTKDGKNITDVKHLADAAELSARRVKKFNFDYNDLTPFEKTTMRRVVPFYTWMRKNIPLQLEMLATKPGRVAVYPKGMSAIERLFGQQQNPDEPLAGLNKIIPQWLQQIAGVPIGQTSAGTPRVFAPQLPLQDLTRLGEGNPAQIMQNLLATTSPFIRGPAELAAGKQFFTGQKLQGGTLQYLLQQLPQTRGITQIPQIATGQRNALDILLSSLGLSPRRLAGIYDVTPAQQRGEIRRIQDPLQVMIHNARLKKQRSRRRV